MIVVSITVTVTVSVIVIVAFSQKRYQLLVLSPSLLELKILPVHATTSLLLVH